MIKQGYGKIINISSTAAEKPLANRTPYLATKMGLIGFTRGLAVELGKSSINVNAICPGPRIEMVIDQVAEIDRSKGLGIWTIDRFHHGFLQLFANLAG